MSVFEKLEAATDNRDVDAYLDLMADDCVFVRHQTGETLSKAQSGDMLKRMLSSGGANFGKRRCIYENDDILVVHSVNDYPDGTREALLAAYTLRDGKVVRLETGATPLSK
ncbi:MAG: nuclear transport factor 2 family protein [Hyphomicrobiales bacterium]|nr:nuclear transport factor 2 family protein [Hyphomicrobiales bacterium]